MGREKNSGECLIKKTQSTDYVEHSNGPAEYSSIVHLERYSLTPYCCPSVERHSVSDGRHFLRGSAQFFKIFVGKIQLSC